MLELLHLSEPALIICPFHVQNALLKEVSESSKLVDIQWLTKEEIRTRLLYQINEETIFETMKFAAVSVETARYYLEAMIQLELALELSDHPKVAFLNQLKNHLDNQGFLVRDLFFTSWISNRHIRVIGYPGMDPWYAILFDRLKAISLSYEVILPVNYGHQLAYHPFKIIHDEVHFVSHDIAAEIHSGKPIDHIYLMNVSNDYEGLLFETFSLHGIPYQLLRQPTLIEIPLVQQWLDELSNNQETIASWWDHLSNQLVKTPSSIRIRDDFLNVLNRFSWYHGPIGLIGPLIKDVLSKKHPREPYFKEVIREIPVDQCMFEPNDRVYVIGLNQKSFPVVVRDDGYFPDSLSRNLGLPTSEDYNRYYYRAALHVLRSIPHPILTVKNQSLYQHYELSSLLLREHVIERKRTLYEENITFSERYDQLKLGEQLDQYRLFRSMENVGYVLLRSYPEASYYQYDNRMTGISSETLDERLSHKLVLTPTKLEKFNRCSFAFYIDHVLQLQMKESNFMTYIGELFHFVLKEVHGNDFDTVFEEYISETSHSKKETFFLDLLKEELRFVVKANEEMERLSDFDDSKMEYDIKVKWRGKMETYLQGRIDRLDFLFENDQTYLVVTDYKTGRTQLDLKDAVHGLGIQLLVYLLILKYSNEYNNIRFVGFYLQHILRKDILTTQDATEEGRRKSLRLDGVTNSSMDLIKRWDHSYIDSKKIRKLKMTQTGTFDKNAMLLNDEEINQLLIQLETQINQAITEIEQGHFEINPKIAKGKNRSCEFCSYQDLCYVSTKNFKRLGDLVDIEPEDEEVMEE